MVKKLFVLLALIAVATAAFVPLFSSYQARTELNETATYYASRGPEEVGAANLVTAVVVTYRGLDTLGEVTILFLTAAIISYFLKRRDGAADSGADAEASAAPREVRPASVLLRTASDFLVPFIFLLGAYVLLNGHLSPGGGFQGGAIIASGLVLMLLADPLRKTRKALFTVVESISGFVYVGLGIAGIFLAGGFLDNSVLPLGEFGTLLSAGLLPIIYVFVGLKVGSELSAILSRYQESQEGEV